MPYVNACDYCYEPLTPNKELTVGVNHKYIEASTDELSVISSRSHDFCSRQCANLWMIMEVEELVNILVWNKRVLESSPFDGPN